MAVEHKITAAEDRHAKALIRAVQYRVIACMLALLLVIIMESSGIVVHASLLQIVLYLLVIICSISCIFGQIRAIRFMNELGLDLRIWYLFGLLTVPILGFGTIIETWLFIGHARARLAGRC